MINVQPSPWSVSKELVNPQFSWFWDVDWTVLYANPFPKDGADSGSAGWPREYGEYERSGSGLNPPTRIITQGGEFISFNGSNDRLGWNDRDEFELTGSNKTIICYMDYYETEQSDTWIFTKRGRDVPAGAQNFGWTFRTITANANLEFSSWGQAGSPWTSPTNSLPSSGVGVVALVYRGTDSEIDFYINGKLTNTETISITSSSIGNLYASIGQAGDGGIGFYDTLRTGWAGIANQKLTSSQIRDLSMNPWGPWSRANRLFLPDTPRSFGSVVIPSDTQRQPFTVDSDGNTSVKVSQDAGYPDLKIKP